MIVFGPVPSRRLGRSLGINNIPPKICSYSCLYCQVGRTDQLRIDRSPFYSPEAVYETICQKINSVREAGETIDYLAFVPDGEPTLDVNLGREIGLLRDLGIKIAVITNASLLWREDVRNDLAKADWVSLKVDAVDEEIWRRINRPHGRLNLADIMEGALRFSHGYSGELTTETMLAAGVNDSENQLKQIAAFLKRIHPKAAYVSIPTRPPAEEGVAPPDEVALTRAYQIFAAKLADVELLTGYEGDAFSFTGNAEEDLLSITAVHPMREEAVRAFLQKSGDSWLLIQKLIDRNQLTEITYDGKKYYLRKLPGKTP